MKLKTIIALSVILCGSTHTKAQESGTTPIETPVENPATYTADQTTKTEGSRLSLANTTPKKGDFQWGITIGSGTTFNTGKDVDHTPHLDLQGGWLGNYYLTDRLFLESGLLFESKSYEESFSLNGSRYHTDVNYRQLKLPIEVKYRIRGKKIDIIPYVGGYFSYVFSGDKSTRMEGSSLVSVDPWSNKFGDNCGYGLRAGVDIDFRNGLRLSFGVEKGFHDQMWNAGEGMNVFGSVGSFFR